MLFIRRGAGLGGGVRARGRFAHCQSQADRQDADGEVDRGRDPVSGPHAQRGNQIESRGQRAKHRADGVDAIEQPRFLADGLAAFGEVADQQRQRGAHQDGGGQHDRRGQRESRHRQRPAIRIGAIQGSHPRLDGANRRRNGQRAQADENLQDAVERRPAGYSIGDPPADPGADGQSAHERGQHRRKRNRRIAHHMPELAHP